MKKILINTSHPEEVRVVLLVDNTVQDINIENRINVQTKSNIYLGIAKRVVPSLEAVFIEYGAFRQGFLPMREISEKYYETSDDGTKSIKEGTNIIVQIVKEDRWNKGASLTTFISVAGKYLVIMPNTPDVSGVSKRISGDNRDDMRSKVDQLVLPEGMGVIVRTAGLSCSLTDLQNDLNYLVSLWASIVESTEKITAPSLLFQESSLIVRVLRDYIQDDIEEIIIDDEAIYRQYLEFITQIIPRYKERVKLYNQPQPLFHYYDIESQIENLFHREVILSGGGILVIDHTEAMVTIDINSAKATSGNDISETALNTNLEAAAEIARQLRLRNIGGLVVVDFIDMADFDSRKKVEKAMDVALQADSAKVKVSKLSQFGLMEISRQRVKQTLHEIISVRCPRCNGQGRIHDTENFVLYILRMIEGAVHKKNVVKVQATLPLQTATYLLNGKRNYISQLESNNATEIIIIPNAGMQNPNYDITQIFKDGNTKNLGEAALSASNKTPRSNFNNSKSAVSWGKTKNLVMPQVKHKKSFLKWLLSLFANKQTAQKKYNNKKHYNRRPYNRRTYKAR